MVVVSEIELYNLLREKIGEPQAKALTEYVEAKVDKTFESQRNTIASKADIALLETKVVETKAELLKWMIVLFAPFYVGLIAFLIKQFM